MLWKTLKRPNFLRSEAYTFHFVSIMVTGLSFIFFFASRFSFFFSDLSIQISPPFDSPK